MIKIRSALNGNCSAWLIFILLAFFHIHSGRRHINGRYAEHVYGTNIVKATIASTQQRQRNLERQYVTQPPTRTPQAHCATWWGFLSLPSYHRRQLFLGKLSGWDS